MSPYVYMRDVLVGDLIVLANTIWEVGSIESDATPDGSSVVHLHLWHPGKAPDPRSKPGHADARHSRAESSQVRLLRSTEGPPTGGFRPV